MKKTIVAASLAAIFAAPVAMADVKISGSVQVEYDEDEMKTFNDLVITASEDLGNGMKSSVKMHNVYDDGSQGGADFSVALSGDFGTLKAGNLEGFQEAVFDAFANIDAAHSADLEGNFDLGDNDFKRDEMLQYTSPSMNGLTIAVNAQDTTAGKFEDTEVMVKYSNAGLTVMAGTGEEGTVEYTNFAASYKMGDLEVRAAAREEDSNDSTFIGAKYKMGANTLAAGTTSNDDTATADASIFSVSHAMSKNTNVYVVYKDTDGAASQTVIGMKSKF